MTGKRKDAAEGSFSFLLTCGVSRAVVRFQHMDSGPALVFQAISRRLIMLASRSPEAECCSEVRCELNMSLSSCDNEANVGFAVQCADCEHGNKQTKQLVAENQSGPCYNPARVAECTSAPHTFILNTLIKRLKMDCWTDELGLCGDEQAVDKSAFPKTQTATFCAKNA